MRNLGGSENAPKIDGLAAQDIATTQLFFQTQGTHHLVPTGQLITVEYRSQTGEKQVTVVVPSICLFTERPEDFTKQFFFAHAFFDPGLQVLKAVGGGGPPLFVRIFVLEVKGFKDGLLPFIQLEDLGDEFEISPQEVRVHVFGDPRGRSDLSVGRRGRKNHGEQGDDQLTWKHSEPHVVR